MLRSNRNKRNLDPDMKETNNMSRDGRLRDPEDARQQVVFHLYSFLKDTAKHA